MADFCASEYIDFKGAETLKVPTERVAQIVGNYKNDTLRTKKGFEDSAAEDVPTVLPRYKVRIFGETEGVEDADLPWAYPPYKASGLGPGESFEDELAPNTFVAVDDDKDGNLYIVKVYPNTQEQLARGNGNGEVKSGFLPGVTPDILHQAEGGTSTTGGSTTGSPLASSEVNSNWVPSKADEKQDEDAKEGAEFDRPCPTDKDKGGITGMERTISNLITEVENLQQDVQGIQNAVNDASAAILDGISWLVQEIRRWVLSQTSTLINQLVNLAPLASRFVANDATNRALSIISCLFLRLLLGLEQMIRDLLNEMIDTVLNMGTCVLENFLANFIGQLVGQLTAAINAALGAISSLLGSVISFGNEILEFVSSLIDFLTCRDLYEQQCATAKTWNILKGAEGSNITLDVNSIFEAAEGISNSFQAVTEVPSDIGSMEFTFDPGGALDDALTQCDVDSLLCGPPTVNFFGGDGAGASGNAVVSSTGQLLGVDIIMPGSYTTPPLVSIDTECGNGNGGTAIAGIGSTSVFVGIGTTQTGLGPSGTGTLSPTGIGSNIIGTFVRPGVTIPGGGGGTGGTTGITTGGTTLGSLSCGIYLDATGWTGPKDISFLVTESSSIFHTINIAGIGNFPENVFDTVKTVMGGRYYRCEAPNGTLHIGGDVPNNNAPYRLVVEEGGDDWDDMVMDIRGNAAPFIEIPCLPGGATPGGIGTATVTGVTKVLIPNTGYGYTASPNGSRGGMGRVWAGRCQTIVKRANRKWDPPYDPGEVVHLGYGDMVQFPAGSPIDINCSFRATMIPGSIVTGVNPCYKDMSSFGNGGGGLGAGNTSLSSGWQPKSMLGFDDSAGVFAGTQEVQFLVTTGSMFENNITIDGVLDVTGPEQGPPNSGTFLPGIGWDNKIQIRETITATINTSQVYTVTVRNTDGRSWTGTRIRFNQIAGRNHRLEVEDHTDYDWTDIRCEASMGQFYDIENRADGTAVCKFRVDPWPNLPNVFGYIIDYPYARSLGFNDQDIRYYLAGIDGQSGYYTSVLGNALGPLMQEKIDDPNWGKLPATFTSVSSWSGSVGSNPAGIFDLSSVAAAKAQGFTDQDIRFYLTNRYLGRIGPGVQALLDDPNWGPLADFKVSFTTPACPPSGIGTYPRYPIIPVMDDPTPLTPGTGYSCSDDTVSVIPDRGAKLSIADCDGGIIRLRVDNPGGPFDEIPRIVINSETGYGAEFLASLKFLRPGEMPEGTTPLQVIDCVGKVFE